MNVLTRLSLVSQIAIAILIGLLVAAISPAAAQASSIFGDLFVKALKAVAPILVFVLVMSAVANRNMNVKSNIRPVLVLYLIGTLLAALLAVSLSQLFPVTLALQSTDLNQASPQGVLEVLKALLFKMVDNPITALSSGNFIGVLVWSIGLGLALHHASSTTKAAVAELADAVTALVRMVIKFAPLGIFGLVAATIAETGMSVLLGYSQLIAVLLAAMLIMALLVNPALVYWYTKTNPYPLVFTCLRESGVTAFFTRSSAANIPVNMALCEKLALDKDTYGVAIPLGATINMSGAAITITVLSLAAAHTLGIQIDFATALLLSVVAAVSACGASGVAGGSLLLIPLACSLFGIDNDIAMQVVAIGFMISVVQDSAETALNSSTDVLFTAAACRQA